MNRVALDNASAPQRVEPRRKRRRSSGERAQRAERVLPRIEARLAERSATWADGGRDAFTVAKQDGVPAPAKGEDAYLHRETPNSLAGLYVELRSVHR